MDNITHSLAGALLAEATHDLAPRNPQTEKRRGLLLIASVIANNFPDLDFVYTSIMPPPLGYLLHHRGHTHTLLLLIPQLLLILAVLWLFPSFRKQLKNRETRQLTIIVATLGLLIHMILDSWNSYGVHPFYPFSTKWFYGDLVFIIEPLLWSAFLLPLLFALKHWWSRWPIATFIYAIPVIAAFNGLLTWYSVAAVGAFSLIVLFFAQRMKTMFRKIAVGVAAAVLFLITQSITSAHVRSQLKSEFTPQSPTHKIIDLVLNPMPANPFCWSVLQLEVDTQNNKYITEGKLVSSWPSILPASSCLAFREPAARKETPLNEFSKIFSRDCFATAWMGFARAPSLENGAFSDLRFSQRQTENFTSIQLSEEVRDCPRFIPPWSKPRQDLMNAASSVVPIQQEYRWYGP